MKELIKEYFGKLDERPFGGMEEERACYLRFLDLLCLLAVNQKENEPERSVDRIGALLSEETLAKALEPHAPVEFEEKERLRALFFAICKKSGGPLHRLMDSGNLEPLEMLAFLMALSFGVSRKYEGVYAILREESASAAEPTAGLCHDLGRFFLTEEENDISLLYAPDSFLNTILLSDHIPTALYGTPLRPLYLSRVPQAVYLGENTVLGELSVCGAYQPVPGGNYTCFPELIKELGDVYSAAVQMPGNTLIELCGQCGSGRKYLLSNLALISGQDLFCLNVKKLFSLDDAKQEALIRDLIAKLMLEDVMLLLEGWEEGQEQSGRFLLLLSRLEEYLSAFFIATERPISDGVRKGLKGSVYRIEMPEADSQMQSRLWEDALIQYGAVFDGEIVLTELVSKYRMNPGRIYEAVKNTVFISGVTGEKEDAAAHFLIKKEDLEEQIRRICAIQFKENATRLKSPFVWEDMVLEPESEALLKQVCDRVRFKSVVNETYGFGKKLPYGRGIAVVLYGPPGTGKTMAAQVLANELGLDVYRIDLSRISSKYIGETEKNLGAVFDAARNSNAILFFDEADALFSKRTEVTSSNDKHANAETSYLLQKIEEYPGVSVLATNNMQNFDAAFKRRMTYLISVGIPDEATREKLWEKAFPPRAPLGKDVDFSLLARAVEMSGSNIKSAAVTSAYLAAAKGGKITMNEIADAVDLECRKNGRMNAKNDILQAMAGNY